MQVICKPIDIIAVFDKYGTVKPIRFKIMENDERKTINIDRIVQMDKSDYSANRVRIFTCESIVENYLKTFQLRYDLNTMRWDLYKM